MTIIEALMPVSLTPRRCASCLIDPNSQDAPQFAVAGCARLGDPYELCLRRLERRDRGGRVAGTLRDGGAPGGAVHRQLQDVADRSGPGGRATSSPSTAATRETTAPPRPPRPAAPAAPAPRGGAGTAAALGGVLLDRQTRQDRHWRGPRLTNRTEPLRRCDAMWQLDLEPHARVPAARRCPTALRRRLRSRPPRGCGSPTTSTPPCSRARQASSIRARATSMASCAAWLSARTRPAPASRTDASCCRSVAHVVGDVGNPLVGVRAHRHHHAAAVDTPCRRAGRSARAAAP